MTDTITLIRGADYPIPASLKDSAGSLISGIGAWTIKADAIKASTGAVLVALTSGNGKVTVGATAADITFTLSEADIALLPLGRLSKLRVTLTDAAGRDYVSSAWLSVSRDGEAQTGSAETIALQFQDASIAMGFDARQGPAGPQGAPGANPGGAVLYDQAQSLTPPQKAQAQGNIGVVPGTDVQAYSANLAALAALAPAAGKLTKWTGASIASLIDVTAAGEAMLSAASAAAQKALLSLTQADIPGLTAADRPRFAGLQFSTDLFLTRAAAAGLQLGAADAAAPVAQTLGAQSVAAGTSNTAGQDLSINASRGTGTGAGGKIVFNVAPAGAAGSAPNALAAALTLASDKGATFAGNVLIPTGFTFGLSNSTAYDFIKSGIGASVTANAFHGWLLTSINPGNGPIADCFGNHASWAAGNKPILRARDQSGTYFEVKGGGQIFVTGDLKVSGNLVQAPAASVAPSNNGELVIEATSNTMLTFKLKGSDGIVRSGTMTLA